MLARSGLPALAALAVAVGLAGPARAEVAHQRLVLDQAVVEPSLIPGLARLRLHVTAVDLNGAVIDLSGDKRFTVVVGGSPRRAPLLVGQADAAADPLAMVLVVENAADYQADLGTITGALADDLLGKLPATTQVSVLPYGERLGTSARLSNIKAAQAGLASIEADADPGAPALLDAVERALITLRKVRTTPPGQPVRKVIVVVSDGRDRTDDRERTTQIGRRAAQAGVRIHTLAYSPTDMRRPLLALGELSRQSHGTFRWVRTRGEQAMRDQVERLRAELTDQYVLTMLAPAEDLAGKKVLVRATVADRELESNDAKLGPPRCSTEPGTEPCATYCSAGTCVTRKAAAGRSVLGTVLRIGGIGLGVVLLLGVIGWLMSRRTKVVAPASAAASTSLPAMAAASSAHLPAMAAAAPVGAQIYILTGPLAGTRMGLRHGFMLGAAPGCDIIAEGTATPHHAHIASDGRGGWVVVDRGSASGTFVNGVRVTEQRLQHGVTIRVGSTDVRFLAQ